MAGVNNNLKPVRSKSEATARGRKGGIASGKTRAKAKLFKELILETPESEMQEVVEAMTREAKKGDVQAATWLANYSGQKPQDNVKIDVNARLEDMTLEEKMMLAKKMQEELEL